MKKNEMALTKMIEKKSKHGNLYFEGKCESGGRFIMRKVKNKFGEKIWELFITK